MAAPSNKSFVGAQRLCLGPTPNSKKLCCGSAALIGTNKDSVVAAPAHNNKSFVVAAPN